MLPRVLVLVAQLAPRDNLLCVGHEVGERRVHELFLFGEDGEILDRHPSVETARVAAQDEWEGAVGIAARHLDLFRRRHDRKLGAPALDLMVGDADVLEAAPEVFDRREVRGVPERKARE